jgi:hypothetical protein
MTTLYITLAACYAAIGMALGHTFYLAQVDAKIKGEDVGIPIWAAVAMCVLWPISWSMIFVGIYRELRANKNRRNCGSQCRCKKKPHG